MESKICYTCGKSFTKPRSSNKQWAERKYCSVKCSQPKGKNSTHGLSRTPIYKAWKNMMARCYKEICREYNKWYGARGIKVSKDWHNIQNFASDMVPNYKKGLQLDRINNSKGYSKSNCRWVTSKENNSNTRSNRLIDLNGVTRTLSGWAEFKKIKVGTLWSRLKKGYSLEEALNKPVAKFNYDKNL